MHNNLIHKLLSLEYIVNERAFAQFHVAVLHSPHLLSGAMNFGLQLAHPHLQLRSTWGSGDGEGVHMWVRIAEMEGMHSLKNVQIESFSSEFDRSGLKSTDLEPLQLLILRQ